jgi:histidinol dehydrogenase
MNFIKEFLILTYQKRGIESLGPSVITLANYEGLAGHALSVKKKN